MKLVELRWSNNGTASYFYKDDRRYIVWSEDALDVLRKVTSGKYAVAPSGSRQYVRMTPFEFALFLVDAEPDPAFYQPLPPE